MSLAERDLHKRHVKKEKNFKKTAKDKMSQREAKQEILEARYTAHISNM